MGRHRRAISWERELTSLFDMESDLVVSDNRLFVMTQGLVRECQLMSKLEPEHWALDINEISLAKKTIRPKMVRLTPAEVYQNLSIEPKQRLGYLLCRIRAFGCGRPMLLMSEHTAGGGDGV